MNFMEFLEDVQLTILSAAEVSAFAVTSRRSRSRSLCRPNPRLWYALSHRLWGRLTHLHPWAPAAASSFRTLYRSLARCDHLVGFWRRIASPSSPLLFFDWVPSFVAGSRLSPVGVGGGYGVAKTPFLCMGVSPGGEPVNFLHPDRRTVDFAKVGEIGVVFNSPDSVPVHVNFVGRNHLVVEENLDYDDEGGTKLVEGSSRGDDEAPLEVAMAEIYQYFANRTSPGGDGALRKQRGKGRLAKRRFESEHHVRVVNCSPTPSRPLQGLLEACREIGDSSEPLSCHSPVFWTSDTTLIQPPFSEEEEEIYDSRVHINPHVAAQVGVSRILYINSSYDLALPDLTTSSTNLPHVEGRIWQYEDGTFGSGFLRSNFVVDMKHIAANGHLLDAVEHPCVESLAGLLFAGNFAGVYINCASVTLLNCLPL